MKVDGQTYVIQDLSGKEVRLHVDGNTNDGRDEIAGGRHRYCGCHDQRPSQLYHSWTGAIGQEGEQRSGIVTSKPQ
jgi:hypothetical protein